MPPIHPSLVVHAPLPAIRRYAQQIAERFEPDKIILFGSRAWGEPHPESDVDLFVIMPTRDPMATALKIEWELPAPFPMDLFVRTPANVARRLKDGESFLTQVVTRGKVLYEKGDAAMGAKGGGRLSRGRRAVGWKRLAP